MSRPSTTNCRICTKEVPRYQIIEHLKSFHQKCSDCEKDFTQTEIKEHRKIRCDICRWTTCNMNIHLKKYHPSHHLCDLCSRYTDDLLHQSKQHWCGSCEKTVVNMNSHNRKVHTPDPNVKHKNFTTHKCIIHSGSHTPMSEIKECPDCKIRCYA
ncbi:MAG: hypothetical protein PHG66_04845 [Candidatus Colwellbacteria bacterium]|nr:hypothetical protein [Candidatus Colwellbacteria bacterium]